MKNDLKLIARRKDIVIQELGDETLIYDLEANKAFCLNKTSTLIWQFLDGTRSVSEVSNEMSKKTNAIVSEDFVRLAIDQLNKDGLLEDGNEVNKHFSGLSRREVIRKVGIASVITLPLVSSVVAPAALMAQSGAGGVLSLCTGAGSQGSCNSGLECAPTIDVAVVSSTPTGMDQCCSGGGLNAPNSTFCSSPACSASGFACCGLTASPSSPAHPVCVTAGINTCVCD